MPIAEVTTPAKSLFGRALRIALAAVLLVVAAGIVAPFVTMASYSGRIREALEAALGRRVEFQKLHLTLFSGPGFLLDSVTIGENPRYGLEPFAFVPTLDARLRLDKLILGRIQFSSLRLVDPSLNLVKKDDGTWNVVTLVERLSSPRRVPLSLFPVIEISGGRLNFKLGVRKTTLYISDSDLSIYPERSGKLYLQFSGSPARTDRAGNGFGHFRGTANWYLVPAGRNANQLEANLILDPSNLSEITTLFEGYDIGVHGTISSRVRIEGPATALRLAGELRLEDVHRWDLLPSSGEDWQIRYTGGIDLPAKHLEVQTVPSRGSDHAPVAVQMRVDDFLRSNHWTVAARLADAPAQNVLPLASRMGLSLPPNLSLTGTLNGGISYAGERGLSGEITVNDLSATVPGALPLTAKAATVGISEGRVHLSPTVLQTSTGNTLEATGDYLPDTREVVTTLRLGATPLSTLKSETAAWFGEDPTLGLLTGGEVSGHVTYTHEESNPALWSGQIHFADSTLSPAGLGAPLKHSAGRLTFNDPDFQIDDFSATLASQTLQGSYRHNTKAKPAERLHLQIPSLDISRAEDLLGPTFGKRDFWTRLRFGRYRAPVWLASRDLDGTIDVAALSLGAVPLGSFRSHFLWKGTGIQLTSFLLKLPEGSVQGQGNVNLSGGSPRYRFTSSLAGLSYKGGYVDASGEWQTSGAWTDAARNFRAGGTFSGTDITLSPKDTFSKVSGAFQLSFADGWPDLRLSEVNASDDDGVWTGEATSNGDGTLLFDIQDEGRQRHVVTSLVSGAPAEPAPPASAGNLH